MTWLTVKDLAALKGCSAETIRRALRNDTKRARLFPSAYKRIEGNHTQWLILSDEADAYAVAQGRPKKEK